MHLMTAYDMMETARNTNQWMGATARALGSNPFLSMFPNIGLDFLRGWGEVTERSFSRMSAKPDWDIPPWSERTAAITVLRQRSFCRETSAISFTSLSLVEKPQNARLCS